MAAVNSRDQKFILSILDKDILNSFGGSGGIEEFKETWRMDNPSSELWDTLTTILSLGGLFLPNSPEEGGGRVFCAPYLRFQFPEDIDASDHLVVIANKINVRTRPTLGAPIVTTLSYDIVRYTDPLNSETIQRDGHKWEKITTLDGKTGFTSRRFLRSPMDYGATFKKIEGEWRMVALVGGD